MENAIRLSSQKKQRSLETLCSAENEKGPSFSRILEHCVRVQEVPVRPIQQQGNRRENANRRGKLREREREIVNLGSASAARLPVPLYPSTSQMRCQYTSQLRSRSMSSIHTLESWPVLSGYQKYHRVSLRYPYLKPLRVSPLVRYVPLPGSGFQS